MTAPYKPKNHPLKPITSPSTSCAPTREGTSPTDVRRLVHRSADLRRASSGGDRIGSRRKSRASRRRSAEDPRGSAYAQGVGVRVAAGLPTPSAHMGRGDGPPRLKDGKQTTSRKGFAHTRLCYRLSGLGSRRTFCEGVAPMRQAAQPQPVEVVLRMG